MPSTLAHVAGVRGSERGNSDTEPFDTEDFLCFDIAGILDDDLDMGGGALSGVSGVLCARGSPHVQLPNFEKTGISPPDKACEHTRT